MRDGSDRMALTPRRAGLAAAALGTLLLGGCSRWDSATYAVAQGITDAGGAIRMPWRTMTPPSPEDTPTIQRIRYAVPPPDQLRTEPGDVWPGPQPQRATLASPDAALRSIPEYTPVPGRDPNAPPPPGNTNSIPRPPGPNRGSSSPPPPVMTPVAPPPQPLPLAPEQPRFVPPMPGTPQSRSIPQMPPRADGQVINTPSGQVITSGGTDRIQSFTVPGGGSGTAIRDGNTTTLIGPDGRVQVVPSAPR